MYILNNINVQHHTVQYCICTVYGNGLPKLNVISAKTESLVSLNKSGSVSFHVTYSSKCFSAIHLVVITAEITR